MKLFKKGNTMLAVLATALIFCGSAIAMTGTEGCPDGDPNVWVMAEFPEQNVCLGQLMPEDFGTFNEDGTFTPNDALYDEIGAWGTTEQQFPDFRTEWLPTKTVAPTYTRFDIKWLTDAPERARFIFQGGVTITFPRIWRVTGPSGEETGYFMADFGGGDAGYAIPDGCVLLPYNDDKPWFPEGEPEIMPDQCTADYPEFAVPVNFPEGEDPGLWGAYVQAEDGQWWGWNPNPDTWNLTYPDSNVSPNLFEAIAASDINPCCKHAEPAPMWMNFDTMSDSSLSYSDVAYAEWNGLRAFPIADMYWDYKFLKYQMGPNEIQDVFYGDVNTDPEVYFEDFQFGIIPELGINYVTVMLTNGHQFDVEFNVTHNFEMPTVSASFSKTVGVNKVTKSGKVINNEHEVITPNIVARELNDALVIQWAEPDGALTTPYMKLRMYIGDGWSSAPGVIERETYLFVDCPVQSGTVVIPAVEWQPFKQKMLDLGRTEVDVAGMYRMQTQHELGNGLVTDFHNRGYFEAIQFSIQ